jgi:hypothetical protein
MKFGVLIQDQEYPDEYTVMGVYDEVSEAETASLSYLDSGDKIFIIPVHLTDN